MAKPGLAKCAPERHAADQDVTRWFARWCREQGISVRDLQAILKLQSIATAQAKLSGKSPPTLVDIKCFPRRFRHELISMFVTWCDACDSKLSNHG